MNIQKDVEEGFRRCFKCDSVKELSEQNFHRNKARPNGFEYKCKDCERKRKKTGKYSNLGKKILNSYKQSDKVHNREFGLTLEFITSAIEKDCTYCTLPNSGGLDRIDNSLGHTIYNCVPCCSICNYVKSDEFTKDEMTLIGQVIKKVKLDREKLLVL